MSESTGADEAVRTWFEEEGWGVLGSPSTPGGCWTHFSVIDAEGYRALTPGAKVQFRWEHPGEDGYDYAATWVQAQP